MMARSYFRQAKTIGLLLLVLAPLGQSQPGRVISWGTSLGHPYEPKPGNEYMAVCAGGYHSLALTADGTLVAWGENMNGQCNAPLGSNFVAIAAGLYHNLALRADGTVAAWGDNSRGQCDVPPRTRFLAIAAGTWHSLGIRFDGSLVAWGWNQQGQCNVPAGYDYVRVAGGYYHSVALKADRSLVAWGSNGDSQCDVPAGHDFVQMAAGSLHNVALKADGALIAWGRNREGQCRVPAGRDFIAIAAGSFHSLALQADGHVEAWGQNEYAQCDTPAVDNIALIAAGGFHSLALLEHRLPGGRLTRATPAGPKSAVVVTPEKTGATHASPVLQPADLPEYPPAQPSPPPRIREGVPLAEARDGGSDPQPAESPLPAPIEPSMTDPRVQRTVDIVPADAPGPAPVLVAQPYQVEAPATALGAEDKKLGATQASGPPTQKDAVQTPSLVRDTAPPVVPAVKETVKTDSRPSPAVVEDVALPGGPEKKTPPEKDTPGPAARTTDKAAGSTTAKPTTSPTAVADMPADLNDPVRQGLTANLYLDSGARAVPVYHFTSVSSKAAATANAKQHFCTISEEEKYKLIDTKADTWKYEGIAFFAYPEGHQPPGARPVHRFWSESLNRYFFTMDEAQKQTLVDKLAHVWKYEGVAWYAPPLKPSGTK
jgi:hypothetical protein